MSTKVVLAIALALGVSGCAQQKVAAKTSGNSNANLNGSNRSDGNAVTETGGAGTNTNDDVSSQLSKAVIHFDFNGSALNEDGRTRLTEVALALRKNKNLNVRITGNTDERGTEEYNMALGQDRAEVAKKYLATQGIEPTRLSTVSYGKEQPVSTGHDESAWQANRRDEITLDRGSK